MFAESKKNRLLASELLHAAHRVWVEDTDLVVTTDGRRRLLTGRLVASYVTAAQILRLREVCAAHSVKSESLCLNRVCLNTLLNENIAGRSAAFRVETDSDDDDEETEDIAALRASSPAAAVAVPDDKTSGENDRIDGKGVQNDEKGKARVGTDLGKTLELEQTSVAEIGTREEETPMKQNEADEDPRPEVTTVNSDKVECGEEEKEGDVDEKAVGKLTGEPSRPLKSYFIVPLSSEEDNDLEESSPPRQQGHSFSHQMGSVSTAVLKSRLPPPRRDWPNPQQVERQSKRTRSPSDDSDDEGLARGDDGDDSDWEPTQIVVKPVKRRRVRKAPLRRRQRRPLRDGENGSVSTGDDDDDEEEMVDDVTSWRAERPATATAVLPPAPIGCNFADCGELFGSLGLLARHLETVHREASILRCPLCGKYFTLSVTYEEHLAENHLLVKGKDESVAAAAAGVVSSALPVLGRNQMIGKYQYLVQDDRQEVFFSWKDVITYIYGTGGVYGMYEHEHLRYGRYSNVQ
jgi:uncharacterized C2H2 Zn-finger protein